jgi:hypothetical protein
LVLSPFSEASPTGVSENKKQAEKKANVIWTNFADFLFNHNKYFLFRGFTYGGYQKIKKQVTKEANVIMTNFADFVCNHTKYLPQPTKKFLLLKDCPNIKMRCILDGEYTVH